ncbi:MAG TPA: hypothetical protein VMC09_09120 [Anaerolineales bacterium]|nr:hypothetical protein [Anaerolineales bacterium]
MESIYTSIESHPSQGGQAREALLSQAALDIEEDIRRLGEAIRKMQSGI